MGSFFSKEKDAADAPDEHNMAALEAELQQAMAFGDLDDPDLDLDQELKLDQDIIGLDEVDAADIDDGDIDDAEEVELEPDELEQLEEELALLEAQMVDPADSVPESQGTVANPQTHVADQGVAAPAQQ